MGVNGVKSYHLFEPFMRLLKWEHASSGSLLYSCFCRKSLNFCKECMKHWWWKSREEWTSLKDVERLFDCWFWTVIHCTSFTLFLLDCLCFFGCICLIYIYILESKAHFNVTPYFFHSLHPPFFIEPFSDFAGLPDVDSKDESPAISKIGSCRIGRW